ncbi:hypothetical protein [Serratia marcescens]|uniref:hypothetical protein n=1 Tax=Serratia marcescens TaxID=615 RepID=UPI004045D564
MLRQAMTVLLALLLLSGCVTQRYAGVSITSTTPLHITKVMINGDAVVLYSVDP